MEQERAIGCIFVDTPKECSRAINGKCIGYKLGCVFSHIHLIIAEDAKDELVELFKEEINSKRRYKRLSGLAGRENE